MMSSLQVTSAFVEQKLKEMGYEPKRVGTSGVVATIGKDGKKMVICIAASFETEAHVEYGSVCAHCDGMVKSKYVI